MMKEKFAELYIDQILIKDEPMTPEMFELFYEISEGEFGGDAGRMDEFIQGIIESSEPTPLPILDQIMMLVKPMSQVLPDEQKALVPDLFDYWEPNKEYKTSDVVKFKGDLISLYTVTEDHISEEKKPPNSNIALYQGIPYAPDGKPIWSPSVALTRSSAGYTGYSIDTIVWHNRFKWISLIDNNIEEPSDASESWEKILEI